MSYDEYIHSNQERDESLNPEGPLNLPPSPAIEGREEDRDWEAKEIRRRIDEQKSENSTSALIERAFVMGYFNGPDPPADYVKDIASGRLTEAWERCKPALRLSPTSPAGAEGEGETKAAHPEDLKQVEKTILEVLDTRLSAYPVPANFRKIHISGKQKAANYLALWMTGFWGAMDEGAEQWRSDFMGATEKLCAAHAKIAQLLSK
jgi:hypothetical protein